ncbi:MAG: hypothetical protein ACPG4Z_07090 [Chitinophagales bacterium]
MKTLITTLLFFLTFGFTYSQDFEASNNSSSSIVFIHQNTIPSNFQLETEFLNLPKEEVELKFKTYNSGKKKAGIALTTIGLGLTATGIAMMATADELYYSASTNGGTQGDPKGGFGVVVTGMGVGGLITGAILWAKGNK